MRLLATPHPETGSVVITGEDIPQSLVTVYRYNADGTNTILRGAQNMPIVLGTLRIEDTEATFNVPLRYVLLFSVADGQVIQENLLINPSFETNVDDWVAGPQRSISTVVPTTANSAELPAFVGSRVLHVSPRTPLFGESLVDPIEASLVSVNADFATSSDTETYEFSFRTRLANDGASYHSDDPIVIGGTAVTWEDAYNTYPTWNMPISQNLTWQNLETAYISTPNIWVPITNDPLSGDWPTYHGIWDGTLTRFTVDTEFASNAAVNYVTNPTFSTATSGGYSAGYSGGYVTSSVASGVAAQSGGYLTGGYTAGYVAAGASSTGSYTGGSTSGTAPVLTVTTLSGNGCLKVDIASDTVGPRISFTASGLTVGTEYEVGLDAIVPTGQTLMVLAQNDTISSAGVTGDSSGSWVTESVYFTATTTTETFNIQLASNVAGTIYIDHVKVVRSGVDYFDGSLPNDQEYFYDWTGAANSSTSTRIPYGILYAPVGGAYEEYEPSWQITPLGGVPIEVQYGIISALDGELVVTSTTKITAATTVTGPIVDTTAWADGWRPYVKIASPGATVVFSSRYHIHTPPRFYPYLISFWARVFDPVGTVILTSSFLGQATAGEWTAARWRFDLPATVVGQYTIQVVPEISFPAAATAWQFDAAMLEMAPFASGRLDYLDGDVPVPPGVMIGWVPPEDVGPYDSSSDDAEIRWTGIAHASTSEFVGPSKATFVLETILVTPDGIPGVMPGCEPINLTDPTVPSLGAWFTLSSFGELAYGARSASFVVLNRRSPIVVSQKRATATGSMVLLLQTLVERQRLLDLLESGRVLMIRNPDPAYPENNWYLAIENVSEARIAPDHRLPYRRFTLEFQVVDRPGGLVTQPVPVTWADVLMYTTWGTNIYPDSVLANVDSWSQLVSETPTITSPFSEFGAYAFTDGA